MRAALLVAKVTVRVLLFRMLNRPLQRLFMASRGHRRIRRTAQRLAFWLAVQTPRLEVPRG